MDTLQPFTPLQRDDSQFYIYNLELYSTKIQNFIFKVGFA